MTLKIIAEIGINHDGDLDTARRLIDVSADAGCDAAKFQLFSADALYPRSAGKLRWTEGTSSYEYDIHKACGRFALPPDWIEPLMAHCRDRGLDFLCSVFDEAGLRLLAGLGVTALKLASSTVTHLPLLSACARAGLPLYLSLGAASLAETAEAVERVTAITPALTLMHCSLSYPTPPEDCHLGVIDTLRLAFPDLPIGYSDHTMDPAAAPVQAVRLGATVIEKHITLSKARHGPDHFFALEPHELKAMAEAVRHEAARIEEVGHEASRAEGRALGIDPVLYGGTAKICRPGERYLRDFAYPVLFAARDIAAGEAVTTSDIAVLRPGAKPRGLDPKHLDLFAGRGITAKKALAFEDPITWDAIL